jgi:hypothetical protein
MRQARADSAARVRVRAAAQRELAEVANIADLELGLAELGTSVLMSTRGPNARRAGALR